MKENSLPKKIVLKKQADISSCFRQGVVFKTKLLKIILQYKSQESNIKVAFLVSKRKSKKAVVRNRIKRYLREIFRNNKKQFPINHYILFMVRMPYEKVTYNLLVEEFKQIIESHEYTRYTNKALPKNDISI